ncbi:MAG: hypothetical protein U9Q69_04690 [Nanoarchaeota archaeon]|nr:hypothetical protein [Nanoarchaeota archaeon]
MENHKTDLGFIVKFELHKADRRILDLERELFRRACKLYDSPLLAEEKHQILSKKSIEGKYVINEKNIE